MFFSKEPYSLLEEKKETYIAEEYKENIEQLPQQFETSTTQFKNWGRPIGNAGFSLLFMTLSLMCALTIKKDIEDTPDLNTKHTIGIVFISVMSLGLASLSGLSAWAVGKDIVEAKKAGKFRFFCKTSQAENKINSPNESPKIPDV